MSLILLFMLLPSMKFWKSDSINCILLGAAIVSIIIGLIKDGFPRGLIDGTSIIIALMIIIVVNSVNNYISERRLAALINSSNV